MILGTAAYMSPEQARGQGRRPARRHLGLRRRPLRDAGRPTALRGRDGLRRRWPRSSESEPIDWDALPAATPPALRGAAGAMPRARPASPAARHRRGADRPGKAGRRRIAVGDRHAALSLAARRGRPRDHDGRGGSRLARAPARASPAPEADVAAEGLSADEARRAILLAQRPADGLLRERRIHVRDLDGQRRGSCPGPRARRYAFWSRTGAPSALPRGALFRLGLDAVAVTVARTGIHVSGAGPAGSRRPHVHSPGNTGLFEVRPRAASRASVEPDRESSNGHFHGSRSFPAAAGSASWCTRRAPRRTPSASSPTAGAAVPLAARRDRRQAGLVSLGHSVFGRTGAGATVSRPSLSRSSAWSPPESRQVVGGGRAERGADGSLLYTGADQPRAEPGWVSREGKIEGTQRNCPTRAGAWPCLPTGRIAVAMNDGGSGTSGRST